MIVQTWPFTNYPSPDQEQMWPKKSPNEALSPSSFHVAIKIDALEARRRINHQYSLGLDLPEDQDELIRYLAVIDPDMALRKAMLAFVPEVREAYGDVKHCYVPERSYLATAVLAIEEVFQKARALMASLRNPDQGCAPREGWFLRAAHLVMAIERAQDELEEMRTELAKELSGPQAEIGGSSRSRLWKRLGKGKDLAMVRRVEGAYPFRNREVVLQQSALSYYL